MYEENESGSETESTVDVNDSESSSTSPSDEGQGDAEAKAAAAKQEASNVPFHEHPRFKELVEQKNQALAAQKSLEEKYAATESRIQQLMAQTAPKNKAETDEVIEHLKTIDPKFAARIEQLSKALPTVESLQAQLEQQRNEAIREKAVTQVNGLHEQNKVAPKVRDFINAELDLMAMKGQIKNLDQLPKAYNDVYGKYKSFIDELERTTRESYVKDKKSDTLAPTSQPKGKPVNRNVKKQTFSTDRETALAQVTQTYLKQAKAGAAEI